MSLPTNFFIGRGGSSELPAITGLNLSNVSTYTGSSGTVYYKPTSTALSSIGVTGGGVLYVAMVGAGGAGGRRTSGGNGGVGIAKITIPTTDQNGAAITRLYFLRGEKGEYQGGTTGHSGGYERGGSAGNIGGGYSGATGGSGGGIVGIQAGIASYSRDLIHAGNNVHLAYVGSGGGGAHVGSSDLTYGGGHGGGINRNGLDGHYDGHTPGTQAFGGKTTAGGAHAVEPGYVPQNATDGSALRGGDGGDSDYDGSGGGGAGYFGGGGGKGGGGYDGGPGGGGSGFAIAGSEIIYAAEVNSNPGGALENQLATHTSDSGSFFGNVVGLATNAGQGGADYSNGINGTLFVWNGL